MRIAKLAHVGVAAFLDFLPQPIWQFVFVAAIRLVSDLPFLDARFDAAKIVQVQLTVNAPQRFHRLRHKIEDDPAQPTLILTVRGGYVFSPTTADGRKLISPTWVDISEPE